MREKLRRQLRRLGIQNLPGLGEERPKSQQESLEYRRWLWEQDSYDDLILFVRQTISSELSRKLEQIIDPPNAVGLAEDVSMSSLKWFLEYWWTRQDEKSPDLAVAPDNTVVAYWPETDLFIKVRFLSSGLCFLSVKHQRKALRHKDRTLPMPARQLPVRFV